MTSVAQNSQKKLRTLIIWRLFVASVLIATTWLWSGGLTAENPLLLFSEFAVPFLVIGGLSVFYFWAVHFNRNYGYQVRVQFLFDLVLVTWLVWETGDISSPYITLFIVLISTSSLFVSPRETLLLAAVCALTLAVLPLAGSMAGAPSPNSDIELSKLVQIVGFNVVAFLVVGILASRLAERKFSGEELKEATRSLASLRAVHERIVESIRSGLITSDLDGTVYTFNAAASQITGFTPKDVIGRPVTDLLPNFADALKRAERESAEDGSLRFECDLASADGFMLRIGYNIAPLFSEEGEKSGLIITFQDLTQIRLMEESARRTDRLAALGRVAAGLAHEIRNPLGAMRGSIQVLKSGMPPESNQAGLMDIVIRESDRLNNIITNFLLYARPRVSNFSEVDVREAVNDTMTLLEHSPEKLPGHVLVSKIADEPLTLTADPTQLKQIFWNLARNSLQSMRDGGTFTVEATRSGANRVRIVFSDTGCGMPPEQVEKLFEPFSESTTGGTGLGLSIVYQIVKDHGGSISVRSLEAAGTTISVELPARRRPFQLTELPEDYE